MKPDNLTHQHKMTLHNIDLVIEWKFENDRVKIIKLHFGDHENPDLLNFMSGKVFRLIIEDIEKNELKRKWL